MQYRKWAVPLSALGLGLALAACGAGPAAPEVSRSAGSHSVTEETTAPAETTAPETAAPETAVPETAAPETAAPETAGSSQYTADDPLHPTFIPETEGNLSLQLPAGMEEVPLEAEAGFYTRQLRRFNADGEILYKVLFSPSHVDAGTVAQMDQAQRIVLYQSLDGLELKEPESVTLNNGVEAIRTQLVHNEKYPGWNWTLSDGKQTAVVTLLMTEEYDEIRHAIETSFAFTK